MKKVIILGIIIILIFLAGNTHRFLPESVDDCQTDITHIKHLDELPMYHCLGHTEYVVDVEKEDLLQVTKWDHFHSWMTIEWHLQQGFDREHAIELIRLSSQ